MIASATRHVDDKFVMDASSEADYRKEKTQNVLTEGGVQRIIEAYPNDVTIDKFSYLATKMVRREQELISNDAWRTMERIVCKPHNEYNSRFRKKTICGDRTSTARET